MKLNRAELVSLLLWVAFIVIGIIKDPLMDKINPMFYLAIGLTWLVYMLVVGGEK